MARHSTVLLGGARSGKSDAAVTMAMAWGGPVTFVATAVAFDDDMAARIERHKQERPTDWALIEEPINLSGALRAAAPGDLVVIDCLTVWVGTLMHHGADEPAIHERAAAVVAAIASRPGPTIVISNEVGLGLHPETPLGRQYRDVLGRVNQRVVAGADRAFLLVAGRAIPLLDMESMW
jgi:adenosylcobinamide kinase / adenosylcobinamide-phosphate guanylyltransferase